MSLDAQTLASLFELSRDAVLGVADDRRVVFANPAAKLALDIRPGDAADALLPAAVLDDPSERFVSSAQVGARVFHISALRCGGVAVFTLVPASPAGDAPISRGRALRELGGDLLSARLAIDALVTGTNAEEDARLRTYAAVLYRSYYRIKRLQEHLTAADAIGRDVLPFTPRLIELGPLCAALCDTAAALVSPLGIGIVYECRAEDTRAMADGALLEKLLLNLLSNSLLHASAGDAVRVSLSRQDRRLVLAVDDPGRGIPPERLAELFVGVPEPDLTDTAAGAGLGLVLVRGIAEKHGGSLILESRKEGGTRTRVWLPQPESDDPAALREPVSAYRIDGMDTVLTELSTVLDKSWYCQKSFD